MAHPSDEDFRLFGKILFYGLIIPALFYYIYQGIKFCFNFIFPTNSNDSLETPDKNVKVDNTKFITKKPIEATESLINQENNSVYLVVTLNMISAYSNPKQSFLQQFFQPSPPPHPSLSDRLEDTIKNGRRSFDVLVKDRVYSSLESATKKVKELDTKDDIILEITSNSTAYCVVYPEKEEVRFCSTPTKMSSIIEAAFTELGRMKKTSELKNY